VAAVRADTFLVFTPARACDQASVAASEAQVQGSSEWCSLMDEAAALRAESPLLYELVVHGSGWRYEQTPSAEADDGWRNVRELPCEDGPDGSPPTAADGGSAAAPAGSVLVDGSAGTLRDQALRLLRLSWRYWQAQTSPWP